MPKWGACWCMTPLYKLCLESETDERMQEHFRNVYWKIDHVGTCESEEPATFLYAVQEVLLNLLEHRRAVFNKFRRRSFSPLEEIFNGLVEAAFRMQELTLERGCAFWTSGYEADGKYVKERMRCSQLPPDSPDFKPPPHLVDFEYFLRKASEYQVSQLRKLAESELVEEKYRKRLHDLRAA